jgi:hypothetical protein
MPASAAFADPARVLVGTSGGLPIGTRCRRARGSCVREGRAGHAAGAGASDIRRSVVSEGRIGGDVPNRMGRARTGSECFAVELAESSSYKKHRGENFD